jgi:hypothetical protein
MKKYIIFQNDDGRVSMIIPTGEIAIEEVARKDVPAGKPYLFVADTVVLPDDDFFEAWEADFSTPDGHGIGAEAWFAEQAAKKPKTSAISGAPK